MFFFLNTGWATYFQYLDTIVFVKVLLITETMLVEKMQPEGIVIFRKINIIVSQDLVVTFSVTTHAYTYKLDGSAYVTFYAQAACH